MRFDSTAVYATLALLGGPALFAAGFRDLRLRRLIQNTPTSRIRSMAMGLAEVNGVIECRSAVEAPFSGRRCAFWHVDISTQSRRNQWTVVHRADSGHPFFLRDDTGLALVYPAGAQCKVNFGVEEVCNGITLPEPYVSYLGTLGHKHYLWRLAVLRFRERVLEEGTRVYVMGTATPPAQALTVSDGEAMMATGTDEWRATRLRERDQQVAAVLRSGQNDRTFIISQQSEREIALGLGVTAMAKLVAGPAITVCGLGFWLYALSSGAVLR
jgi:E3 ubiquitin ligase